MEKLSDTRICELLAGRVGPELAIALLELCELRAQRAASRERVMEVVREACATAPGWRNFRLAASDVHAIAICVADALAAPQPALDAARVRDAVREACHRWASGIIDEDTAVAIAARAAEQLAGQAVVGLSAEERAVVEAARLWRHAVCDLGPDCGDGYTYHSHDCPTNEAMRGLVDAVDRLLSTPGQGSRPGVGEVAEQQTGQGWIPPSQRVPDPGPCTPMAHCWGQGYTLCKCGEATRDGDCSGWAVASKLTDAQIYEAVTGRSKVTEEPTQPAVGPTASAVDPALCRRLASDLRANKLGGELVQWIDRQYLPGDDDTADRVAREIRDAIDGGWCEPLESFEGGASDVAAQLTAAAGLTERYEALKVEHNLWCAELGAGWLDGTPEAELAKVIHERDAAQAECERLRAALDKRPLRTFDQLAADRLADEVAVLVRRKVIDARSPAGDALLDYRDPPPSPRADRLATLEAEFVALRRALWARLEERQTMTGRIYDLLATEPAVSEARCAEPWQVARDPHDFLAAARQLHALRAGLREIVGGEQAPRAWAVTPERVKALRSARAWCAPGIDTQVDDDVLAAMLAEVSP